MASVSFIHLRTHSYFSFLEGIPSPEALVKSAKGHGMGALGLTDHYGLTGAIDFYLACQSENIKPILGLELPSPAPIWPRRIGVIRRWTGGDGAISAN